MEQGTTFAGGVGELSCLKGSPQPVPEGWDFTPLEKPQRVSEQLWPPGTRPWVSILTLAYQHAPFIRETLESFLMQETTFPVEIVVHDDASRDGTADILREYKERYPNLIRLILQKENQFQLGRKGFPLIYEMAQGFYAALCEGDDYWSHPRKLEMQSALLGVCKEAVLCGHRMEVLKEGQKNPGYSIEKIPDGISFFEPKEIFMDAIFPTTQTLFFRKKPIPFSAAYQTLKVGDRYFMSHLCAHGGIVFIPLAMAVYRVHSGGIYSMVDPLKQYRNVAEAYRAIIKEIPTRWGAASAVALAKIGVQSMRMALRTKKKDDIGFALGCCLRPVAYCLRGIRGGMPALESLGRIFWLFFCDAKAFLKRRLP